MNAVFFAGEIIPNPNDLSYKYFHYYVVANKTMIYTLIPAGYGYSNKNKFMEGATKTKLQSGIVSPCRMSNVMSC